MFRSAPDSSGVEMPLSDWKLESRGGHRVTGHHRHRYALGAKLVPPNEADVVDRVVVTLPSSPPVVPRGDPNRWDPFGNG